MWQKIKTAARWVYDWITVLAASLVGAPAILLQFLSYLDGVDFSPFIGTDRALKIVTTVAIAKAILAFIVSLRREQR